MLTMKMMIDQLTGSRIAASFIQKMIEECQEFAAEHQRYTTAMDTLRKELGDAVTQEMDAIQRQCASNLRFSGLLGLKANLDHFNAPTTNCFLNEDFEVFLQEKTAHLLPDYQTAQADRSRFYATLTPEQKAVYEPVITYTCTLETVGPKLAHYYGYLLGNQLWPLVVPGYHEDVVLTMNYTKMLNHYFQKDFSPCQVVLSKNTSDML